MKDSSNVEATIRRVEHHPLGLLLLIEQTKEPSLNNIERFWLRRPEYVPHPGDVIVLNGATGVIEGKNTRVPVRRYAPNGLEQLSEDEVVAHA